MDKQDTSTQGSSLALFPVESPDHRSAPAGWLDALPSQSAVLRAYQLDLLSRLMAALKGFRRVIAQAPTGAGKSHLIASLVAAALLGDLRILILATRTRLVRQLHERLDDFKLPHGIIAASLAGFSNWSRPIQIASVDTLYRRCTVDKRMPLPPADLVIFDEAHLALGASRRTILNSYPLAWHVGFTATPAKTSGVALDEQFDDMVLGPSVGELIALRALCPIRIFSKPVMSARELNHVAKDSKTGDYATGELSALMSRPKLVGDVVENWLRIANGKRTLVFACDKKHGAQIREEFSRAGVACEQLTDDDRDDVREDVIARLEGGVTQVLVNCFLLSYGIDIPAVECFVLGRPTRSVVLYLQAIGRGMRPSPGKDHMILIDHGRVVENLGLPTYERDWSLRGVNINTWAREQFAEGRISKTEKPRHCAECSCLWSVSEEGSRCPSCGWQPVPKAQPVQVTQTYLGEIGATLPAVETTQQFYREACDWYATRWPDRWQQREKSGRWWAWMQTREKFKRPEDERMPSLFWNLPPVKVSMETAGWLKSKIIAYAKAKKRDAA